MSALPGEHDATDPEVGGAQARADRTAQTTPGGSGADPQAPRGWSTLTDAADGRGAPDVGATIAAREIGDPEMTVGAGGSAFTGPPAVDAGCSFGDYELIERIATGGMGAVYLARQKSLRRLVALKMILAAELASAEDVERFRKEAEVAAQLDHKGIVPIFEVGERAGRAFFSMAYIDGGSLAARLKDGPVPCRQAVELALEVAEAVAYAHDKGIIHRDLKPSNVLLGKDGHTRVADFGLAKLTNRPSHLTNSGQVLGTPSYMAPEQAAGKTREIGPRVDVYSLGALLYCLITGRPPFQAATAIETLRQVIDQEPVSLRHLNGSVSRDLDTICRKCLEKDPAKRYDSVRSLAGDLRRFLAGEPIKARPVGSIERLWRWCRRNPSVAWLTGGILASLFGGFVVAVYFAVQAERKAAAALQSEVNAKEAQELSERRRYAAEIHLAEQDYQNSQVPTLEQRLGALEPRVNSDPDLRSFEWYYLERLCHLELRTLRGHEEPVLCVAFRGDGRELASAGGSLERGKPGTIRVWDSASGACIRTLKGHTACVQSIAYDPSGTWLASSAALANQHGEVKLWDASSEREARNLHTANPVWSLAFSPDGRSLAGGSGGYSEKGQPLPGEVLVWDVAGGRPVRQLRNHRAVVRCVAFSPDGEWLASADALGTTKIWRTADWTENLTLFERKSQVMSIAFSPDSRRFATGSLDRRLHIWDTEVWKTRQKGSYRPSSTIAHSSEVHSLVFSPDGGRLAAGYGDRSVRVWDVAAEREVLVLRGHGAEVNAVAFSPDGWRLASASADRTVRIWDATADRSALALYDHQATLCRALGIAICRDGSKLAAANMDLAIRIWDPARALVTHVLRGHTGAISDIAWSADGRRLVSTARDRSVRVWDTDTAELVRTLDGFLFRVRSVALAPSGQWLACAGGRAGTSGSVVLWDFPACAQVTALAGGGGSSDEKEYEKVVFSPDSRWLAAGRVDGGIRIWSLRSGAASRLLLSHTRPVLDLEFSLDSRTLASASADGSVKLWDVEKGDVLATMVGHAAAVTSVTFTPDRRRLVSCGDDRTVKFWDVHTGQEVFSLAVPWSDAKAVVHADGRRLVVCGGGNAGPDYSLAIWDARTPTGELRDREEARSRVAFWYGRLADRDQVRERLITDQSLVEPVRQRALALVDAYGRALTRCHAEDLLAGLVAKAMFRDEILESVRTDPKLDGLVRGEALALGASLVENAFVLDKASREVVRRPGAAPAANRRALKQAETACRLVPYDADYRTTLGMAEYRVGSYRQAVATLTQATELNSADPVTTKPAALAFTAMAQYQLNQSATAHDALQRLRELIDEPPGTSEQVKEFFREAEQLIEHHPATRSEAARKP